MTRLSWSLIRLKMIDANRYFPDMPRRDRIKWAIARLNAAGPKCGISTSTPKVPDMFVRSYFR